MSTLHHANKEPLLYFSKHEQNFLIHTYNTGLWTAGIYRVINNVYVTMPQAGFDPPIIMPEGHYLNL